MGESVTSLHISGTLTLKPENPTLADLEAFCEEARKLGVADGARLCTFRHGLLGPVNGWYFSVPVIPKVEKEANGG